MAAPVTSKRAIRYCVAHDLRQAAPRADLLRHSIPNGDPAAIFDRALSLLLADLERAKLAATARPRAARPGAVGWQVQLHRSLAAGSFSLVASAETYLSGAVGKRWALGDEVWITLSPDEHRDDLTIPRFKAAVLSGRVVDEHDKPVVGFWVEAWPRGNGTSGQSGPSLLGS